MNNALSVSGVNSSNTINSVGLMQINSTFSGECKNPIMLKMISKQAEFVNIDQEMITAGADIAFLITSDYSANNCYPGYSGRIGGVAATWNEPTLAFAQSAQAYVLGDLTALHEIGHVFGGHHSNEDFTYNGTPNSARGLTFTAGQETKQTIMGAYDTAPCYFTGVYSIDCERIGYFSTPNVSYNGVTLGDSTRDMVSWLNTNMPVVSGWRGVPVPPPNTPNPITATNALCFGFNTVNWTAQTGATEYKLYKSTSSSFTSPTEIYSGTNTVTGVNVSFGTWYLRAKACNASGCSAYSNQVTAYRYNGCI